ncbi:hypothetical protein EVAR_48477_1 [Eumeta japonica]|uniref:Uncharacterized protein n=1 Tax=Eumeta variegata TaxID=151549 RepID=A0A4C1XII5_EUMVA|nr:hypothetical protein EVAR_48477_1 [Eumeta japonica]
MSGGHSAVETSAADQKAPEATLSHRSWMWSSYRQRRSSPAADPLWVGVGAKSKFHNLKRRRLCILARVPECRDKPLHDTGEPDRARGGRWERRGARAARGAPCGAPGSCGRRPRDPVTAAADRSEAPGRALPPMDGPRRRCPSTLSRARNGTCQIRRLRARRLIVRASQLTDLHGTDWSAVPRRARPARCKR